MISIDRLEEMTIEELQIKLKNFEEQIKLQNNFIDSLFKATNNSKWLDKSMLDDEVSEVIEKIELDYEQLDQLKAENEELKSLLKVRIEDLCDSCGASSMKLMPCKVYEKTLTEIKPILEYYANSTIGEEQEDGTYRIELSYKYGSSNMYGAPCYYKYNPKPARQALQKISECEGNNGK